MASKGCSRHQKKIAAPRIIPVARKGTTWITKPNPGAHRKEQAVAIAVVIRDILKIADTMREAKKILKEDNILVDGKTVTDPKFPVGFMDTIEISKTKRYYRVLTNNLGKIILKEITQDIAGFKLCRIKNKTILKKGKVQINFEDGRNQIVEKDDYKTGDVVKLSVPEQKILEHVKFEKGSLAYVNGGKHSGKIAQIKEISKGTITVKPMVTLESENGEEFKTSKNYVFLIGKDKPMILIG